MCGAGLSLAEWRPRGRPPGRAPPRPAAGGRAPRGPRAGEAMRRHGLGPLLREAGDDAAASELRPRLSGPGACGAQGTAGAPWTRRVWLPVLTALRVCASRYSWAQKSDSAERNGWISAPWGVAASAGEAGQGSGRSGEEALGSGVSTVLCAEEAGERRGPGRQPGRGPGWSPWFPWAGPGDPAARGAAQVSGAALRPPRPAARPPTPARAARPPAEAGRLWGGWRQRLLG